MEKKAYLEPKLNIVLLSSEDVLTESPGSNQPGMDDIFGFSSRESTWSVR